MLVLTRKALALLASCIFSFASVTAQAVVIAAAAWGLAACGGNQSPVSLESQQVPAGLAEIAAPAAEPVPGATGTPAAAPTAVIGPSLQERLAVAQPSDVLQVIVTFHGKNAPTDAQLGALRRLGLVGTHLRAFPIAGVLATPVQILQLTHLAEVRSIYHNDRLDYDNEGGTNITSVKKLRSDPFLLAAHASLPFRGKGVTVMINDSGIDGTHEDLKFPGHVIQNVYAGGNLHAQDALLPVTIKEDVSNTDFSTSHGTHVAGIVGAAGARSAGKYTGVAPDASLIGYGSGAALFVLDALGGFDYAKLNKQRYGIRIITNSFGNPSQIGMPFDPEDPTNVVTQELAEDLGMVVVFSAGNSGNGEGTITGVFKKAPWVILAANGTKEGRLANSSSRGQFGYAATYKDTRRGITYTLTDRPTVIAPGTSIVSTRAASIDPLPALDSTTGIEPAHLPFYTIKSGTSMSAPHVAGIIALMLEANPELTWREVKTILEKTATNVADLADWEGGAGYVNAHAAVAMSAKLRNDFGATNKLYRNFNSKAKIIVGSSRTLQVSYAPVNNVVTGNNYREFVVAPGTSLVLAFGVLPGVQVYPGTMRIALEDPDGVLYNPGQGIPGAFLSGYRSVSAPGKPGVWKVSLRGTCGLSTVPASACPASPSTNGLSTPTTEPVNVIVKEIVTQGFDNLADVVGHPSRSFIEAAVALRLVDGRAGQNFQPNAALTRIELAEYLTLGPGLRQHLPLNRVPTFTDLEPSQHAVAEAAASKGAFLMDSNFGARAAIEALPGPFNPGGYVTRTELAYSLVQALGFQAFAQSFTGPVTYRFDGRDIPVSDLGSVPPQLYGYLDKALDLGLINPTLSLVVLTGQATPTLVVQFKPTRYVTRAEYAVASVRARDAYAPRP